MKTLIYIAVLMISVIGISSCSGNTNHKTTEIEKARLDSIRQDSLRKDSIAYVNFETYDLALFNLHGHVKKVELATSMIPLPQFSYTTATFTSEGMLLGGANDMINSIRDTDGRIIKYNVCGSEDHYISLEWDNNIIAKVTDDCNGYSDYVQIVYPQYENKRIVSYEGHIMKHYGDIYRQFKGQIKYSKFDAFGNWTEYSVQHQECNYINGEWSEWETEEYTRDRRIEYYNKENVVEENATQLNEQREYEDYIEKENAQKQAVINKYKWLQGTWHLDIDGPNGISVANYTLKINGNNATMSDGRNTKYSGSHSIENGKLYLGNAYSFDINESNQSLHYRQYRLTKEGGSSSWNGSFRTDSDVMRYLCDRTFYSNNHRMAFTYNSVTIDGHTVSGSPIIRNVSSTTATIVVNPIGGGRAAVMYLNASNGSINYEGDIFQVR